MTAEDWNVNAMSMSNCCCALGDDVRKFRFFGFFVGEVRRSCPSEIFEMKTGEDRGMAPFRMCMWDQEVEMTAAEAGEMRYGADGGRDKRIVTQMVLIGQEE